MTDADLIYSACLRVERRMQEAITRLSATLEKTDVEASRGVTYLFILAAIEALRVEIGGIMQEENR